MVAAAAATPAAASLRMKNRREKIVLIKTSPDFVW
jgi:hypothetical protein